MARASPKRGNRKGTQKRNRRSFWLYLIAALALAAFIAWSWNWYTMRSWAPSAQSYPEQGVAVGEHEGAVAFKTLLALGGQFAYLHASAGAKGQDARFGRNLTDAKDAGLKVGAIHRFDPCSPADSQSANFVTMVPRDDSLLPPVIGLERIADDCDERVSDASVESELMTFINQVEMHSGKPAILKLGPRFEQRYRISAQLERGLWLSRDRAQPAYAGRPWLLWSANHGLMTQASDEPLEWVVVQP